MNLSISTGTPERYKMSGFFLPFLSVFAGRGGQERLSAGKAGVIIGPGSFDVQTTA